MLSLFTEEAGERKTDGSIPKDYLHFSGTWRSEVQFKGYVQKGGLEVV